MKKRNLIAVLMMTAALAAGCGAKADTTTAAPTQAETTKAENRGKNGICDRND